MQNNGNPKRGAKISPLIYSYKLISVHLKLNFEYLSSVLICKDVQLSTETSSWMKVILRNSCLYQAPTFFKLKNKKEVEVKI